MARSSLGGILVTLSLSAASASTWAQSSAPPSISFPVVVRNFGGVSVFTIDQAESIVDSLYRPIGVQVRWVTPEELRRELPVAPKSPCEFASLVRLNLISPQAENELARDVLGTSIPSAGFVRIATRRIAERAAKAGVPAGSVLGQVMAHEIGHVLLPPAPHSLTGLMKERLDVKDMAASRVTICPREAADMRCAIAERQSACGR